MMEEFDFLRLTAHLKIKSTSPILFQIHFQNQFSWVKLLEAVRRERLYGRCNYLNRRGKGTGQWRFCRAKFKIILRLETEKRFWHGDVALKITAQLVTLLRKTEVWSWYCNLSLSYEKPKSEADIDMGFPVPHVVIIVNILSEISNLNVIMSFSEEATLIFYSQRRLTSSAKAECEVLSSWWFYFTPVFLLFVKKV